MQLLSRSGSIFVSHDVEVDVHFAACSSLSDNTLARAHKWLGMIKEGTNLDDVAKQDNTSRRRIQQIIAFAFLAPDIVQMILDGRQPIRLTSEWVLRHKLPNDWQDQRALIATL